MDAESEEIGVARDDQIGLHGNGARQYRIVIGITADRSRERRGATSSARSRISAIIRSGSALDWVSAMLNFGRMMIPASSATNSGELTKLSVPARIRSRRRCGVPRQIRPDTNTLASMTARTPPPFGPVCLHLRIDLFHRHGRNAGRVDALGESKESAACRRRAASVSSRSSASEVRSPASRAAFAVASGSSISIFVTGGCPLVRAKSRRPRSDRAILYRPWSRGQSPVRARLRNPS